MNTVRAIDKLKSVWAGNGDAHVSDDTIIPSDMRNRSSGKGGTIARSARLDLRITHEEKKRIELLALRDDIAINRVFSRMLELYEREYGRVELISHSNTSTDGE